MTLTAATLVAAVDGTANQHPAPASLHKPQFNGWGLW